MRRRVDLDRGIEARPRIRHARCASAPRRLPNPFRAAREVCPEVVVRDLVRRDHAGARAGLDRHVAHCHALIHGQRANGRAAVFHYMAGAARHTDLADDGEDQILGGDAGTQLAFDIHREGLRPALQQGLRGEHMSHFGGTDAEGQRAEGPVGAGVAVAQTMVMPGCVVPSSGPMMCTMPRRASRMPNSSMPNSAAFASSWRTCLAAASTLIGSCRTPVRCWWGSNDPWWRACGRDGAPQPQALQQLNACGELTS